MEQSPLDDAGAGLALLGAELRERAGELADGMVARIRAAVPVYGPDTVISNEELRRTCLDNHLPGPQPGGGTLGCGPGAAGRPAG